MVTSAHSMFGKAFPPAVTRSSHKDHEQQTPYLSSGGSIGPWPTRRNWVNPGVTCCRATIRKTGESTHCVDKSNSEPATIAAPTEWTFWEIKYIKSKRKTNWDKESWRHGEVSHSARLLQRACALKNRTIQSIVTYKAYIWHVHKIDTLKCTIIFIAQQNNIARASFSPLFFTSVFFCFGTGSCFVAKAHLEFTGPNNS